MPFDALMQYEELEALLAFAPSSVKEYGGWPISDSTHYFATQAFCDTHRVGSSSGLESEGVPTEESAASLYWPCQEGFYRKEHLILFYYYLNTVIFRR